MEINEIISKLKDKFGDKLDIAKVTQLLSGMDHSKMSFAEITEKIKHIPGLLGDLDHDGKVESAIDEIKGTASKMFGGMFGK